MKRLINRQKTILEFIRSCDEALAQEPGNMEVIRLRGLMYNIAGEYDKALTDFEQIIKDNPMDSSSYYLKSDCHFNKGEFDLAKRDYMRALKTQFETKFTHEDINKAIILDDEDLNDIKTIIAHEKQQAIDKYFKGEAPTE
ncbi:MAG: hypothetical protein JST26_05460 [Bacteroidetes bacterium]|nr:hypothetical protein [Bacteroidota bacterium]